MLMMLLVFLPAAAALALCFLKQYPKKIWDWVFVGALAAEAILTVLVLCFPEEPVTIFSMTDDLPVTFQADTVSRVFISVSGFGFLLAGIYATRYMEGEERIPGFYSFMLLSEFALMGMDLSSNLITMYLFFELATLLSMPLVLQERTEESIRAALKYLFYSVAGAFLALACIFILNRYCENLNFAAGGILPAEGINKTLVLVVVFLGAVGFGAKAGMYPLHGWLPTAHPVAPSPASAVLSGVITKAGVLAILRLIYYIVGTELLRGTWVQYAWLGLATLTVFMGSMMAYREDVFKKRLAYSSVSQISYVLVGLFIMNPQALEGSLLHVLFHAAMKIGLFMVAGSFLTNMRKGRVSELVGVGLTMPVTMAAYTVLSLGLVGIPPICGFVSKWYLALGALQSETPVFYWLCPTILLVSALLTAGYLLPLAVKGFFPGKDFLAQDRCDEGGARMWAPIVVLAVVAVALGIFCGPLTDCFLALARSLM